MVIEGPFQPTPFYYSMRIWVGKHLWRPLDTPWSTDGCAGWSGLCLGEIPTSQPEPESFPLPHLFETGCNSAKLNSLTNFCLLVPLQLLPTKGQKSCFGFVSSRFLAASVPLQGVGPEWHRLWHQHGAGGCAARYLWEMCVLTQPAKPGAKALLASACNAHITFPGPLSVQVWPLLCWWMSPPVMDSMQHFSLSWSILSLAHRDISQWVSSGTPLTLLTDEEVHAAPSDLLTSLSLVLLRSLPCPEPHGGRSRHQAGPRWQHWKWQFHKYLSNKWWEGDGGCICNLPFWGCSGW